MDRRHRTRSPPRPLDRQEIHMCQERVFCRTLRNWLEIYMSCACVESGSGLTKPKSLSLVGHFSRLLHCLLISGRTGKCHGQDRFTTIFFWRFAPRRKVALHSFSIFYYTID